MRNKKALVLLMFITCIALSCVKNAAGHDQSSDVAQFKITTSSFNSDDTKANSNGGIYFEDFECTLFDVENNYIDVKNSYVPEDGSYSFVGYVGTDAIGDMESCDPTKQCPRGYQIPNKADYTNLLGSKSVSFRAVTETSTTVGEKTFYNYIRRRTQYDGGTIADLYINKVESEGNPNFVLMGFGHQYDNIYTN